MLAAVHDYVTFDHIVLLVNNTNCFLDAVIAVG